MSQTKKRRSPHKQVFLGVAEQIAKMEAAHGFVDHPFYKGGWDREDQVYERYLIRKDTSKYVDQYEIRYRPANRQFFFYVRRSRSTPELVNLLNSGGDARDWTDAIWRHPSDRYDFRPHSRWEFSMTPPCCLKKRDLNDPDAVIAKMMKRYRKYADQLFKTLDENHQCWSVRVDYYNSVGSTPFLAKMHQRIGRL